MAIANIGRFHVLRAAVIGQWHLRHNGWEDGGLSLIVKTVTGGLRAILLLQKASPLVDFVKFVDLPLLWPTSIPVEQRQGRNMNSRAMMVTEVQVVMMS